ncbi:MAG: hypothetical protein KAR11_01260 [Phycisphaerae bacterium]|nr:hypothetical protein [Phycisphaerae bacterium]
METYLQIIVGVVLAVIGWVIGNYFSNKRSLVSKRREIVTEHLINAYRILTCEISHRELIPDRKEKLENILSDIQLFGSLEHVELARELTEGLATNKAFELDPLINSLRDDLREELNLKNITGNIKWLRFSEE